ncbi:LamG-like jellyroll fold domain-containing protein [Nonomuraea sp. NPDC050202]|uniref:LamG-like jellyroll fold domain-containing protein n=1 Tax=Nonomuraea sp. NPDC050202 TaxID=3155035 RepID=UPI0033E3E031
MSVYKLVNAAGRPRPTRRHLALGTALTVAASLLVAGASGVAQADPEPTNPATPAVTTFPRPADPDAPLRAVIAEAKKQNKPVAVEEVYTESSRTWAYPDGHVTVQSYAGPSQLKQGDGSWAWIDTSLVEKDGVLKPKLAKADVQFSLGGDAPFASLERDKGQRFALSWLKDLPQPKVEGNVATYVDAAGSGADLVLTALPDGFRHDVILRERPSKPVEIRIPVETDNLSFSKSKDGMLKLADESGAVVAQAPAPVMTEAPAAANAAAVTGGGQVAQAQSSVEIATRVEQGGKGKSTLVLTPDPKWLADPDTQYPVVVDPTTTLTLQSNFYLYYSCGTSSIMSGNVLWAGSSQSSCAATQPVSHLRTYLDFDTTAIVGRAVGSAQLELYASRMYNGCSYTGALKVSRLVSDWGTGAEANPTRNWANKPKVAEAGSQLQVCPAYSSIPRAVTWEIKDIANAWATGATDYGLQIRGENEIQDTSAGTPGWVEFDSSYKTGGRPPKLTVSYMLPPEIPTVTAESIDSIDGTDAIARAQNVKIGFTSSVPEVTNLSYTVTVNESTMVPPPTAPTGHVAHWKFDEDTGAAGAADASGNGHTATYSGSRRKSVTGKLGSAIELNDMSGSNGCCVPDAYAATSQAVLSQNSSFSISTWVKLKNSDTTQYVASQDGDPFGLALYYLSTSQKWRLQVTGAGGSTGYGVWVDTTQPVRTDAWSHLVALYDASAGKIRLYVDGALSAEADYQPSGTVTSGPFRIGARKGDSGLQYLQGAIDDMRLYRRALTAKEVKDLYGEVAATSYNAKPSGQVVEQTFALHNPASLKFVVKACRSGVTPSSCNESPAYRITSDAPVLPTDTGTGMADPTQPILSGMVNRPSGGQVTAKYYLYDNNGTSVGPAPLGIRTVNGGQRASFQIPTNTVQPGSTYTWQMRACVGEVSSAPDPDPEPDPTPTPNPDLKARWSFDEATGTTAADASGNDHTVTLNGAAWATGKDQSGVQLNGTSSSYGVTDGPVVHTNASYTVSGWARIDNTTADHTLASQDGAVNSAFKLGYAPGDKKWRMITYQSDTTNATPVRALSTQNATANQWTHLVGVYDATAGRLRLYVNGVLNADVAFTSNWDATSNVQIGRSKVNGALNYYLKGGIDEVRLYQRALTTQEIGTLYANPAQTPTATSPATTQEVINGPEVCTAKTAPISFTTPGTPPPDQEEDVQQVTLGKDSFVIKTAKTDPAACYGGPCTAINSNTIQIGGTGTDKTVTVIGFRLDELPDGAGVVNAELKLGKPACASGTCPADTVITATPLKSSVTAETKGSELADDADPTITPFSLPINSMEADIAGSEAQWLLLTHNKDEVITIAQPSAEEQPSLALTYLPAGPPSKVLNLRATGGDASATASWGLPESNGSVAFLNGYDVEVVEQGGARLKTLEVKDPWAAISGLTNDVTYTIKVRAKTAYGVSEWESTSVATKAVPPPPPTSTACVLEASGTAAKTVTAPASESGADAYIEQVRDYFEAQDAVLQGRAESIWDAPGVTPDANNTAKLSLLNHTLLQDRESLEGAGTILSNTTVDLDHVVVQQDSDGMVRVTASVTRTWTKKSSDGTAGSAAKRSAPTVGEVEPSTPTISVFVHDRCGGLSIIDVPADSGKDSTDWLDPCGGLISGSSVRAAQAAADGPIEVICGGDKDIKPQFSTIPGQYSRWSCYCKFPGSNREGDNCELWLETPFQGAAVAKGIQVYGTGNLGWTIRNAGFLKNEQLHANIFSAIGKVSVSSEFHKKAEYKAYNSWLLDNLEMTVTSKAKLRAQGGEVSFSHDSVSFTPGIQGESVSSISKSNRGSNFWRDPETGNNNFIAECSPHLAMCWFKDVQLEVEIALRIRLHKKDPRSSTGEVKSTGWTPWRAAGGLLSR